MEVTHTPLDHIVGKVLCGQTKMGPYEKLVYCERVRELVEVTHAPLHHTTAKVLCGHIKKGLIKNDY